ncbi:type IV toxin-antitoxin system AbiEi family antitoxin domain-containing protein [Flavobacterium sp. ARAG 55.4]|uniref:type IV toxin-antitoxin system AbiEi family antitoxin domain-containing protein n=1 Tax=Flavobacterium sp. ARAG 55.4 TaxID=3451357 RepID=UPI003F44E54F
MDFKYSIRSFSTVPLNRQVLLDILKDYKRPNDKISELIKRGELIPLKKGLYIAGVRTDLTVPEPFLIANHLWGPSYVSLESAMSYWGIIPERVYEVSSITIKSSKKYKTPIGRFSYRSIPAPYYSFGIKSIELATGQLALIASPEKALCDKIITTSGLSLRSPSHTRNFLLDDLRIDPQWLRKFNLKEMKSWIEDAPKKQSLRMLIKTLEKL